MIVEAIKQPRLTSRSDMKSPRRGWLGPQHMVKKPLRLIAGPTLLREVVSEHSSPQRSVIPYQIR